MATTAPPINRTVHLPKPAGKCPDSRSNGQPIRSASMLAMPQRLWPEAFADPAIFGASSSSLRPPQMNSRPMKRPAMATTASVMTSSTTPSAWRKPSDVTESACWVMCMANIWSPGPPSSVGVMKKPMAATNTSSTPAPMPGRVNGNTTRQNTAIGPAPLAKAALVSP